MKNNIFENLPLTIVMILLSAATSFAITKVKVDALEKKAEKTEVVTEEMRDFRAEQKIENKYLKEKLDETKTDLKEILKEIKSLK